MHCKSRLRRQRLRFCRSAPFVESELSDLGAVKDQTADSAAWCSCKSPAQIRTHNVTVEDDEEDKIFLQMNGVADGVRTHDNRTHNPSDLRTFSFCFRVGDRVSKKF